MAGDILITGTIVLTTATGIIHITAGDMEVLTGVVTGMVTGMVCGMDITEVDIMVDIIHPMVTVMLTMGGTDPLHMVTAIHAQAIQPMVQTRRILNRTGHLEIPHVHVLVQVTREMFHPQVPPVIGAGIQ